MKTLTDKFEYNSLVIGMDLPAVEFIPSLCSVDNKTYGKVKPKTYLYDMYITIILSVSNMFSIRPGDMKSFIKGELDSSPYLATIHEELANLYVCYKNTSDVEKANAGYCIKKINSAYRDDIYTTAYYNLNEDIVYLYNAYTHAILHRITERSILNNLENLSI